MTRFSLACFGLAASVMIGLGNDASAQESAANAVPPPEAVFRSPAPPYVPDAPVAGTIKFVGSDTMQAIVEHWIRGLKRFHPDAKFELDCRGSESALPELAKGEPVVALMSRPLSKDELAKLDRDDSTLLSLAVGKDALAVIVHPENPAKSLTREQLQRIYRDRGDSPPAKWGDCGLAGPWADMPVEPHCRDADSVSRRYFRGFVLDPEEKEGKLTEHTTHAEHADAVAASKGAIGYITRTAASDRVKVVPLILAAESSPIGPTDEAIASGAYPLVRELFIVVRVPKGKSLAGIEQELVRYALSRSGQADVVKDGFYPLARPELNAQFDKLGWNLDK
ncbi:MAG: PstS family phosphate ABC transporter substrate-binding protein [Pirellulaceae bacterium]|nr:PstS family phosphate ABC transporter substrate-binding protein [Pirellulaceae bacterium]